MIRINLFWAAVIVLAAAALIYAGCGGTDNKVDAAETDRVIETDAAEARDEYPECPQCGSRENVVPIIYGYPGPELRDAAERGEVKLGGCVISGDDPRWYCKDREYSW